MFTDLHRHLDGSLRPGTLATLADALGLSVPADLPFQVGMGLDEALARFSFTLSVLQSPDAVRLVASELCEDAVLEGVSTLEIRFAPQFHRGAAMGEIVDAALEGIQGRAGLILCGLYGDPPALLDALVAVGRSRPGVVGLDLAGSPLAHHTWHLGDYAPSFKAARDAGLGCTVHAGEGRGPEEIRVAVDVLGAQRIGHGCSVLRDPQVVDLLIQRGVTLEACPTSNVHTSVFSSVLEHPLPFWLERGLRVCVNTDNTFFSSVSAPEEYRRVGEIPGMPGGWLDRVVGMGREAAFRRV